MAIDTAARRPSRARSLFRDRGAPSVIAKAAIVSLAFLMTIEFGFTYHAYTQMWRAARGAAESAAKGALRPAEARARAITSLPDDGRYTVRMHETETFVAVVVSGEGIGPSFGLVQRLAPRTFVASHIVWRQRD